MSVALVVVVVVVVVATTVMSLSTVRTSAAAPSLPLVGKSNGCADDASSAAVRNAVALDIAGFDSPGTTTM